MLPLKKSFNLFSSKRVHLFKKHLSYKHFNISEEVKFALDNRNPVVALESTIISHGMPYPDNLKCATEVENIIRKQVNYNCCNKTCVFLKSTIITGCCSSDYCCTWRENYSWFE